MLGKVTLRRLVSKSASKSEWSRYRGLRTEVDGLHKQDFSYVAACSRLDWSGLKLVQVETCLV